MANVRISDLTAASSLAASDQFEINASGTSKSATAQKIADFLESVSQTLTQKTFDTAGAGNSFKINGTAISAVTGSGSVVLATAPTISTSMRVNGNVGINTAPTTWFFFNIQGSLTGSATAYGIANAGTIASDVTTYVGSYSGPSTQAASFTVSDARGYQANGVQIGSGSAVTNQVGFYVNSNLNTATNNYAFFGNLASASGSWNLYMAGTAANYFGGASTFNAAITYGGVTLSNSVTGTGSMVLSTSPRIDTGLGLNRTPATATLLAAGGNVTGATVSYGMQVQPAVQSDVTSAHYGYYSAGSTAAASFTLSSVRHFQTNGVTKGVGSTITNQYGFIVESTLTAAAANYGFYGALASASGVYNIYMAGTAANYFGGATTFNAALTYGGVTLSNSVTGTGSMVLSASPTFTGTVTTAALTIGSGSALKLGNAYVAGAPTATGYVTIQDSAGTTYKVLVST